MALNGRRFRVALLFAAFCALLIPTLPADGQTVIRQSHSDVFPVAPHSHVGIEWWYLNTHVTTKSGRHLAVIASFFQVGDASQSPKAAPQVHYLIYADTDIDKGSHAAYSLADRNSLNLIKQLTTLQLLSNPNDKLAQKLLGSADAGQFPPPTLPIAGECKVSDSGRFSAVFGTAARLVSVSGRSNTFRLQIGAEKKGGLKLDLTFAGAKPPMYVGGDGNTGVVRPDDMKYVSLTRCDVSGTIDTGSGSEPISSGQGWFDHQWGDSWTPTSMGWDWWGVQLADGRDILMFRMRRLDTGVTFGPMATIEDASGGLSVYRDAKFTPDPASVWESPTTHIRYPTRWTVTIGNLELDIAPDVSNQEMPILGANKAIWEGSVHVTAFDLESGSSGTTNGPVTLIHGTGYMELVGYGAGAG